MNTSNIKIVVNNNNSNAKNIQQQNLVHLNENKTNQQDSNDKRKYKKKTTNNQNENHIPIEQPKPAIVNDLPPKKQKFKKRTDHNAIEKKYRSSINDKILELKTKVAGPDAKVIILELKFFKFFKIILFKFKLQKSGILRRALDYIANIENMNKRLNDENRVLRSALNTISLNSTNYDSKYNKIFFFNQKLD
jgi:hypothetical protein